MLLIIIYKKPHPNLPKSRDRLSPKGKESEKAYYKRNNILSSLLSIAFPPPKGKIDGAFKTYHMSHYQQPPEGKDPELWEIAKKRAGFKSHLTAYIIVNIFLWAMWYFSGQRIYNGSDFPWPLWTTLGWGIGLAFHFAGTYIFPKANSVEREYQKLKNKQ